MRGIRALRAFRLVATLIAVIIVAAGFSPQAKADTSPVVFSGVVEDQHGDVAAGVKITLAVADQCEDLGEAPVVSATSAPDGSFSLSVSPGTYDLEISLSQNADSDFPGFVICAGGVTFSGNITQNLVVPVNDLTVHAQDSSGAAVPGAVVVGQTGLTIAPFTLFPGQTSSDMWQNSDQETTNTQGNAIVPLMPLITGGTATLAVDPPAGSGLGSTTVPTGTVQSNTTVTATLTEPVVFSGVVEDQHGDVAAGVKITLAVADQCEDLGEAPVVSATSAPDGSFSLSVSPGTYDLEISLSQNADSDFPGFVICAGGVTFSGNITQNLVVPVNDLTVHAQDSSGAAVPGAVVVGQTGLTIAPFTLFPGQTSSDMWQNSDQETTNTQGNAIVPLMPLIAGETATLAIDPPAGSALGSTTVPTGTVQSNTTVTATLTEPVVFSGVVEDQHGDVAAGVKITLAVADQCEDLGEAPVVSATSAPDGSFSLSVSPGTYDLEISLSQNADSDFPGFVICAGGVTFSGNITQNLVVPVNDLTVHAQDSSGAAVPGAVVVGQTGLTIAPFTLFPGQTSSDMWQNSDQETTNTQGNAIVPLMPLIAGETATLAIDPPAGSALGSTTVPTGTVQSNTTVTATLAGTVDAPTTTALTASANPTTAGQSVTFTATVSGGGSPAGSVVFSVDGKAQPAVTLNAGTATFTTSNLSVGSHSVTASYSGDAYHAASTSSPLTQTVNQATSTVSLRPSVNPSVSGQAVTFTAAVAASGTGLGTPSGSVVFTVDGVAQPAASLSSGQAALTISDLSPGSHSISAAYSGDATYTSSTSAALTQTIDTAGSTTSVASSANPSVVGDPTTFTATVAPVAPGAGTPTGSVTFSIDGVAQNPVALSDGGASLSLSDLSVGSHTVAAAYSGDSSFAASTSSTVPQVVDQSPAAAVVTSSADPSVSGQAVVLTATVTAPGDDLPTPTGDVVFTVDGVAQPAVALSSGSATLSLSALSPGAHSITADYSGDATFLASASPVLMQTVGQAASTIALASSANPLETGESGSVTATVAPVAPGAGTPTGTVTFTVDGTAQSPVTLSGGTATLSLSALLPGNHSISATYSGDTAFAGSSSAALTETINQATASVALASSANPSVTGQTVTITAAVAPVAPASGTPTGTVTFTVDGTTGQPVALTSGSGTLTITGLDDGTHTITAAYSGDTTFAGASSGTLTQTVGQAASTTALSSSANPADDGQVVTITATVASNPPGTGTPTGTVVFTVDGAAQTPGATLSSGVATLTLSGLAPSSHTITASYQGSGSYAASASSALTETVAQPTSTTTALTTSPSGSVAAGVAVTLTATEAPAAAGAVQFYDGTTALGSPVTVNAGQATYTTTALAVGTHSLTAAFTPSSPAYASSTSAPDSLQVTAPGIAIDQTITKNGTSTITTSAFTTGGPRLLVAFTNSDGPATKQTTTVTGAGLTWTLFERANSKGGTAEIWYAQATGPLTNATVTSTPKTAGYDQSLTVIAFTGASGLGAGATAGKSSGAPSLSLTTTAANSWSFAVGEDYSHATARTIGTGQTMIDQWVDPTPGETFWVQDLAEPTPTAGTKVTLNDTAPTTDEWNMAAVEVLPAG